jgi:hypothetical protein
MKVGEGIIAEPEVLTKAGEAEAPHDPIAGAPAPQRTFTARSRKSIQKEQALEKRLAQGNALKRRVEDTLASLAEDKKRFLKLITSGESWADKALSDVLGKVDIEERKLTFLTEEVSKAQTDLDNFRADIDAYAPERARRQGNLAVLAAARLELDHEFQGILRKALAMLEVREQAVKLMRKEAEAIDLSGSFEAGVPPSLHEALTLEIVSASNAWNARMLGQEQNLKPYVVCGDSFEPEETLTRKAIYHFGEVVWLLEEEATEFLRNDRPNPDGREWERLAPSLMTAEMFAAAEAESGRTGPILKYVLQQKHSQVEQKRFEAYKLQRRGTLTPGQHLGGRWQALTRGRRVESAS